MHPSGFDTRAVASEEATTFLSIAHGTAVNPMDDRIRDVLEANSFLRKISFIRDVVNGWITNGRLGGRASHDQASSVPEVFWEGAQEQAQAGGGKFVWVTVGAPGGDGEYRSISLKDKDVAERSDPEMEALRDRLRGLGARS